jgi:predicted enzyme related to lactoylglutathione lyase
MTERETAPLGAPCWTDLWTSDVEGSRSFYGALFGWDADDPDPQFGGYFIFNRMGTQIAGAMGDMGDQKATNTWSVYLATDDAAKTVELAEAAGATVVSPAMAVGDLGTQVVLLDPTGAHVGAWQPATFPGFRMLNEHAAPSWFELLTSDYKAAVAFYRDIFHWETQEISDTDEFRYTVLKDPSGEGELAGIMDASNFLADGAGSHWKVYWEVADIDTTVAKVLELGGSVEQPVQDTPYGRLAGVADPAGAGFSLRQPPASE